MKNQILDNISGVVLDADFERMIDIDLPTVYSIETKKCNGNKMFREKRTYGEFMFIGDIHYGNSVFCRNVLNGYLLYLRENPNVMIGLMGDILEYGEGTNYIREDESTPIDDQIQAFVSDFKPFAKRVKFILWGNHEERYVKNSKSKNLMRVLALELGLNPDNGECYVAEPQRGLFVNFKSGNKVYGAYVQHSKTNAKINQDMQLQRAGSQNITAMIVHGHTHRMAWKPRTFRILETLNGRPTNVVRRQYLLATGCFLKYPSYAEAGSMPYTEVGAPIVKFYSDGNQLEEYDLTNRYREYLTRGGIAALPRIPLSDNMVSLLNPTLNKQPNPTTMIQESQQGREKEQRGNV
jgi:predicted phosphodiesterase